MTRSCSCQCQRVCRTGGSFWNCIALTAAEVVVVAVVEAMVAVVLVPTQETMHAVGSKQPLCQDGAIHMRALIHTRSDVIQGFNFKGAVKRNTQYSYLLYQYPDRKQCHSRKPMRYGGTRFYPSHLAGGRKLSERFRQSAVIDVEP